MPNLKRSPVDLTGSGSEASDLTSHSRAPSAARSTAQSTMEVKIDEMLAYMHQGSSQHEVSDLREPVAGLTLQLEKATETLNNLTKATTAATAIFRPKQEGTITAAQLDDMRAVIHSVCTSQATSEQRNKIQTLWDNLVYLVLDGYEAGINILDLKERGVTVNMQKQ